MSDHIDPDFALWIGLKVTKSALSSTRSPKPFKSGLKENTVKTLTVNPNTGKPAFTFYEDESIVDAYICKPV
jgi:hypothetical protein